MSGYPGWHVLMLTWQRSFTSAPHLEVPSFWFWWLKVKPLFCGDQFQTRHSPVSEPERFGPWNAVAKHVQNSAQLSLLRSLGSAQRWMWHLSKWQRAGPHRAWPPVPSLCPQGAASEFWQNPSVVLPHCYLDLYCLCGFAYTLFVRVWISHRNTVDTKGYVSRVMFVPI